jgi:hypothetical protein
VARELVPGVFTAMFTRAAAEAVAKLGVALLPVALAIETEAKNNASQGSHAYGTPTPASPGGGPARISGTLVRSITHTEPRPTLTGGVEIRVGPAGGLYSPHNRHTPSSRYGLYLETGLRNGSVYPFLGPAFHKVGAVTARASFAAVYRGGLAISI